MLLLLVRLHLPMSLVVAPACVLFLKSLAKLCPNIAPRRVLQAGLHWRMTSTITGRCAQTSMSVASHVQRTMLLPVVILTTSTEATLRRLRSMGTLKCASQVATQLEKMHRCLCRSRVE